MKFGRGEHRNLQESRDGPFLLLIVFSFNFFCGCAFAFDDNHSAVLEKTIQASLDKARIEYQLPAISISIKFPEENLPQNYVKGYYSLANDKKISSETFFQIGSITKTFTATMILKLVEEHQIDLQQKISKWFPQYPRWQDITVENLLRHTSGVANYTYGSDFDQKLRDKPNKNFSLEELAHLAYREADFSKPGKKYNYTNTDYVLLGMIIEKVTHHSLQQLFDSYFIEAKLTNIFYTPNGYPQPIANKIAHGYNRDGTFKDNEDVTSVSLSFSQSAGAIIATPNDLILWLFQLYNGKIITQQSLSYMMSMTVAENTKPFDLEKIHHLTQVNQSLPITDLGVAAGMGFVYFKSHDLAWVHAGGTPGYESFYLYNPCKGIYMTIMYSVKPKQQLIFAKIANNILTIINQSNWVNEQVRAYQYNTVLPGYCRALDSDSLSTI